MTTEMYVGVPGNGATDVWYKVLLDIEQMKVEEQPFCGAAAEILKLFDQIVRDLVYKMASVAGMPKKVLGAYRRYVEGLKYIIVWLEASVPRMYENAGCHKDAPSY